MNDYEGTAMLLFGALAFVVLAIATSWWLLLPGLPYAVLGVDHAIGTRELHRLRRDA